MRKTVHEIWDGKQLLHIILIEIHDVAHEHTLPSLHVHFFCHAVN